MKNIDIVFWFVLDKKRGAVINIFTVPTMSNRQEAELEEMREIFSLVDTDGGGTVSREEMKDLFTIVGINATKEQLDKMLKVMDSDNSGEIDFEEFSSVMLRRVQVECTPTEVKNAFEVIRMEKGCGNDTKLHKSHIVEFLDSFDTLKGEEGKSYLDLVEQIECDAHGYIDFKEYVDMMMNF